MKNTFRETQRSKLTRPTEWSETTRHPESKRPTASSRTARRPFAKSPLRLQRPNLSGSGGAFTFTLWVVCLIATSSLLKHLPANTLPQACFQEAALALICCGALVFTWSQGGGLPTLDGKSPLETIVAIGTPNASGKRSLFANGPTSKKHSPRESSSKYQGFSVIAGGKSEAQERRTRTRQALTSGFLVVAIGALASAFSLANAVFPPSIASLGGQVAATRISYIVVICLLTALAEEALCRGLCFPGIIWLANRGGVSKRVPPVLLAAVVSSLFFALPHVSLSALGGSLGLATCLLAWAKLVQSAAFGFVMACLYWRTRSFAGIVAVHALFDLAYLGPSMVASGVLATSYLMGGMPELGVLALSAAALAACAAWTARWLQPNASL